MQLRIPLAGGAPTTGLVAANKFLAKIHPMDYATTITTLGMKLVNVFLVASGIITCNGITADNNDGSSRPQARNISILVSLNLDFFITNFLFGCEFLKDTGAFHSLCKPQQNAVIAPQHVHQTSGSSWPAAAQFHPMLPTVLFLFKQPNTAFPENFPPPTSKPLSCVQIS